MTLGNILSQMGIGPSHLTERFSHGDYSAPVHDTHVHTLYTYEPAPSHGHVASSKHHHHGGGGHKSNAAMSALTLLSFLFFLHILQQCLRDHMTAMSTPPVMIMTAGREGEEVIGKTTIPDKIDKTGVLKKESKHNTDKSNTNNNNIEKFLSIDDWKTETDFLTKVQTSEYIPKHGTHKYKVFKNDGNRSVAYSGFDSSNEK